MASPVNRRGHAVAPAPTGRAGFDAWRLEPGENILLEWLGRAGRSPPAARVAVRGTFLASLVASGGAPWLDGLPARLTFSQLDVAGGLDHEGLDDQRSLHFEDCAFDGPVSVERARL